MLLREFVERNSEESFATLITRHVNKVYSVALRHTRNPHQAEEITQAVFVILARKAAQLCRHTSLAGWLYQTARLTAVTFIRTEIRRAKREQETLMQTSLDENESDFWPQIAPLLDDAMAGLSETDRHAVVLRYFDGRSLKEVGTALGGSEDAAKMRVNRAVEKLRKFFNKRGVVLSAAALTATISAHSVQAAPAFLAKSVTAVAITKGAAASTSTLTLIKGALKVMAWTKVKTAVVTGAAVLLVVGGGATVYETNHHSQRVPAKAEAPAEMKVNWIIGKKYSMQMEVRQNMETKLPNQDAPVKSDVNIAQDFDILAVNELPDDGRLLELKITDENLDILQNGSKVLDFDSASSLPPGPDDPAGLLKLTIGVPLRYSVDANGEVTKTEGVDELMGCVAAAKPAQQAMFKQLIGKDTLKQYVSVGEWLPNRVVNIGESWTVKKDVPSTIGDLTIEMNFTFKNWEQHDSRQCAHVGLTGNISTKSISTASGAAVEVEKGIITGEFWFDPALGMLVESDNNQDVTMKITTQAQTMKLQMKQDTHLTLADVE